MKEIRINISPNGAKAKIKVEGVTGESCTDLTRGLEAAMFGDSTPDRELTEEYYQSAEQGINLPS